jgi:methylenetetrahydrofolate dehydrogenase (NADP+)/methenyltetrahydrofolate cyclohydrolase
VSARILDGKSIAAAMQSELAKESAALAARAGVVPHLVAVLVGDDPASKVYVRNKRRACTASGVQSTVRELPANTAQSDLLALVEQLNQDPHVHGILVQLPLPRHIEERAVTLAIDPAKDVDCFHPFNVGLLAEGSPRLLPCTPAAVLEIVRRSEIPVAGAHVAVVGRSNIVGKPLALLLSQKGVDATVTLCHSRTRDLSAHVSRADVVVAAAGSPGLVTAEMLRPGAVVVDVGTNKLPDGRLVGDVDFAAASQVASAITPVPGGVGPMTCTLLVRNTIKAAAEFTPS